MLVRCCLSVLTERSPALARFVSHKHNWHITHAHVFLSRTGNRLSKLISATEQKFRRQANVSIKEEEKKTYHFYYVFCVNNEDNKFDFASARIDLYLSENLWKHKPIRLIRFPICEIVCAFFRINFFFIHLISVCHNLNNNEMKKFISDMCVHLQPHFFWKCFFCFFLLSVYFKLNQKLFSKKEKDTNDSRVCRTFGKKKNE